MTQTGGPKQVFRDELDTVPFKMPLLEGMLSSGEHAFNALKTIGSAERAEILAAATPGRRGGSTRALGLGPGL
ncbi:hypothetical protein ACF08M_30360 [Streptomyces sp. NPDC015032]|uniref:hypothetical protein n=1 Tax=Streptomyces sp. NPDC015032 TaxID=3364937 RepID=UPI0036FAB68B